MNAKTMRRNAVEHKMLLRLPGCWIKGDCPEISHHWLQVLSYQNPPLKSIHKKQQNILRISSGNTPLSALAQFIDFCANHTYSSYLFNSGTFQLKSDESRSIAGPTIHQRILLSINMYLGVHYPFHVIMFSVTDPRARGMIFFLLETVFLISSQPAHVFFLYATSCCCDGQACFQWFIDEPSFPATHGLKAHDFFIVKRDAISFDSWLLTHAALVLFKKQWPAKHAKDANVSAPTLSPFSPTIKKSEDNKMNDIELIDKELIPLLPGIGERIKKFREYRVLTTQKMAQLTAVPEVAISQIETGEIPIPISMLINLCQHLGADINWLLTGEESMVKEKTKSYKPDNIPNHETNQPIEGEISR